jgi:hypothetical protein
MGFVSLCQCFYGTISFSMTFGHHSVDVFVGFKAVFEVLLLTRQDNHSEKQYERVYGGCL